MNKKLFVIILAVMLLLCSFLPVYAEDPDSNDDYDSIYMDDRMGCLTDTEREELNMKLADISKAHDIGIFIATTSDLEGKRSEEYADFMLDHLLKLEDAGNDGILLLHYDMGEDDRGYYILTKGRLKDVVSDNDIEDIGDKIVSFLKSGDYHGAYLKFADMVKDELENYGKFSVKWIFIALGIGLIIALIVVFGEIGKLKSVSMKKEADCYIREGSLNVTNSSDIFLYKTVTSERRDDNDSDNSSSSDDSHGGGGGTY